jgi:hypothetical protein
LTTELLRCNKNKRYLLNQRYDSCGPSMISVAQVHIPNLFQVTSVPLTRRLSREPVLA